MELQFKTFDKQRHALRALRDDNTNEVLYGGGARGGKSWLGCGWIVMECISKPYSAWLIAREELTKLRDTTLLTFFKVLKELGLKKDIHFRYDAQSFICTFYTGSRVFFREIKYIPSDPEFDRLGSYDLTGCFLDECQQIHDKAISVLRGRFSVLRGEGWKTIPKSLYTCNPAKNWIYRDFVRPAKEGTITHDRVFIPSLATDNPFADQAYIDNLNKADKITRARLLYGDFEYDDDPAALMGIDKINDIFSNDFVDGGEKYITADIARFGKDTTTIIYWNGLRAERIVQLRKKATTDVSEMIQGMRRMYGVPMSNVVIDSDGLGGGVADQLDGCYGFVNNSRALEGENFANLKGQCYFRLAELVNESKIYVNCDDPTVKQQLIEELEQVKQKDMDKDSKRAVIGKDKVKELLGRSPDISDTLMMRMVFEIEPVAEFWVL